MDDVTKLTDQEALDLLSQEYLRLQERNLELVNVLKYVYANLDYLARLWGREGVTQNIIDRVREVLKG